MRLLGDSSRTRMNPELNKGVLSKYYLFLLLLSLTNELFLEDIPQESEQWVIPLLLISKNNFQNPNRK